MRGKFNVFFFAFKFLRPFLSNRLGHTRSVEFTELPSFFAKLSSDGEVRKSQIITGA